MLSEHASNNPHTLVLYNPLGLICGCMIFISILFPWWSMTIIGFLYKIKYVINAYPYVLSIPENFPREWMPGVIVTPKAATIVLLLALAAFIGSCFMSSFLRGKKCKLLLGAVGISFLLFVTGFFGSIYYACRIRIAIEPPIPIQGSAFVPGVGDMTAGFQPAFYLAIAAGLLCIISAIFHERFALKS